MPLYRMDDGTMVHTKDAVAVWDEETDWHGSNQVSRATGTQWTHETLYKSRLGHYYIVQTSQWQGTMAHAHYISALAATTWLLHMEYDIPEDLQAFVDQASE